MDLAKIIVRRDSVGRWKEEKGASYFDFFAPAMAEYHYPVERVRGEREARPRPSP